MRLPLAFLILSLPFVTFPRVAGSKLSDFAFAILIVCALCSSRLKIGRLQWSLVAFFGIFAAFGFYYINYAEPITVLGGWDVGLLSIRKYQFVDFFQTSLYVVGGAIYGRYLLHPKSGMLKLQYWYFIIWSAACLLWYFAEYHFSPGVLLNPKLAYLQGTFTEKGVMANYVVFNYCLFLTCMNIPGARKFKTYQVVLIVVTVMADLLFCKADRGTILFILFSLAYFVTRKPAIAVRMLPIGVLILLAMFPLYVRGFNKVALYMSVISDQSMVGPIGRYAAILLTPTMVPAHPLFGVGYGNYIFYRTSREYAPELAVIPKDEPDNTILQILLECGTVGLAIFICLVVIGPGILVARTRSPSIWAYYVVYVISLLSGVSDYFLMWLYLFSLLAIVRTQMQNRPDAQSQLDDEVSSAADGLIVKGVLVDS